MRPEIWDLDPEITYLDHGSFGATPRPVLAHQQQLRDRMERQPVQFLTRDLEPLLDTARATLARFVGADAAGLVFVPNATTGVATVVDSLGLHPGDEIVVTSHGYNAVTNQASVAAARSGATVRTAGFGFLGIDPDAVRDAVLAVVGDRTRLVIVDHVTSPTALALPIAEIAAELEPHGIHVLVDGAHGPGMLEVDVTAIGASYYTGNCHKWLCAPKGAGFLWARDDRRDGLTPTVVSHGWNSPRTDRSRYHLLFDWIGTDDPTPYLAVPAAIDAIAALAGTWDAHRAANRALARAGREIVAAAVGAHDLPPVEMLGSMAAIPVGRTDDPSPPTVPDPLALRLIANHHIEVPVFRSPATPLRLLRISAQAYNTPDDYERLATALTDEGVRATI